EIVKLHEKNRDLVPAAMWVPIGVLVGFYVVLELLKIIWKTLCEKPFAYLWPRLPGLWRAFKADYAKTMHDPKDRRLFGHLRYLIWIGISYAGSLAYAMVGTIILILGALHGSGRIGPVFETAAAVAFCAGFVRFFVA
ncbi:TPA: hypothetical protein ACG1KT_005118, partial [Escherichia coli]